MTSCAGHVDGMKTKKPKDLLNEIIIRVIFITVNAIQTFLWQKLILVIHGYECNLKFFMARTYSGHQWL